MRAAPGPRFPPRRRLSAPTGSRACPHASAGFLVAGETAANKPSPRTSALTHLRRWAEGEGAGSAATGRATSLGEGGGRGPARSGWPARQSGPAARGARCSWLMRWTGASSPKCLGDSTLQF